VLAILEGAKRIAPCTSVEWILYILQPPQQHSRRRAATAEVADFSASYCSHRFDMLLHDATCFVSTMVLLSACCCHMKGNTMLMLRRGSE